MRATKSINIKQLHGKTGYFVRLAGASVSPTPITDNGKVVAVLARPSVLPTKRGKRTTFPDYEAMMGEAPANEIQSALDEIRGDR